MKYRFLDLRRPRMQQRLILRHRLVKSIRDYLDGLRFLEIETPILVRSTPEGARDYLVPSRVNPGRFYALPQSPQLFKQLLMVGGMERYFQIARCFRDEDLRADRQPEFTQLDLEMSFVQQEDIFDVIEGALEHAFRTVLGVELVRPFPRVPHHVAMERYGSDKPDTRFGMEIFDATELFRGSEFKAFAGVVEQGGVVKGMTVKAQAAASRRETDEWTALVKTWGGTGMVTVGFQDEGLRSSIARFLGEAQVARLREISGAASGDMVVMVADLRQSKALDVAGKLRLELARRLKLVPSGVFSFLWVVDFPLLKWNDEENRWEAEHHPFTSPMAEDIPLMDTDPAAVRSSAYDIVLNGNELGSGSIRIHQRELQEQVFKAIGIGAEESAQKFGFLMDAFEYGAPPHGGIALGIDRMAALMCGVDSIREVIAFPKNQNAADSLTGAPVEVSKEQLQILRVQVVEEPAAVKTAVPADVVS